MKNQYGDTHIQDVELAPLAEDYMCKYGVNVNLQRAIPQIADGIKPIQRRVLYAIWKQYRQGKVKVASAIGDVMHYSPHGDQGLGDTIARMCQKFTNNIPIMNAEGNAGNVTSSEDAASPRYLDVAISNFARDVLFKEFDGKVDMMATYDDTGLEPFCLPSRFPLILVNGTSGIGYTLSCDIPPFNLGEIADATIKLIKNPKANIHLVPDLPTGCDVVKINNDTFVMMSSYEIDNVNYTITIKNTPYLKYLENIDSALREIQDGPNPIKEIISADDESDLLIDDFRYVIRCKPCNLYKIVDTLFKRVPGFKDTITTRNMVVVDIDYRTKRYDVRQILLSWIKFRIMYKHGWFLRDLVEKTTKYDMLSGKLFMLSPKNLERTIKIYRDCKTQDDIIKELVKAYNGKVTTSQANYVSDLRLRQLTVNEREKTEEELHVLDGEIKKIRSIVDDIDNIKEVIINEIKDIKNEYGYPRKSRIINLDGDNNNTNVKIVQLMLDGSFIFSETETPEHLASDVTPISGDEVCLIDDKGYFIKVDTNKIDIGKPMTMTSIGKNIMGKCIAAVSNKSNDIIMLSNKGRIKCMPISAIPSNATRKPLVPLNDDEYIVSIIEVPSNGTSDLLIYTNDGLGKRIQTSDLNKVVTVDSMGQFILKDYDVSGMFCINSKKPFLAYVTRLGRIRLNHSRFLVTNKKFADPRPIIQLSAQDDLIAVFCVDKDQQIILNHADSRISTVNIDSLDVSTMATPPERPKHVFGVKVVRATLS